MIGNQTKTIVRSWKAKTVAAILAVLAAIALPQVVHVIGAASGAGSSLGEMLLPMHIAVLVAGLLAGPAVGGTVGAIAPALSFALSGMPSQAVLPFMTVELFGYGLSAGLLSETKLPAFGKLLFAQVAGRALRALAVVVAFYGFGTGLPVASIWTGIVNGLVGIVLQWALVPLFIGWLERKNG